MAQDRAGTPPTRSGVIPIPKPGNDTGVVEAISEFADESTHPTTSRNAARLVMLVGDDAGRAYPVGLSAITIGRAPDADIHIDGVDVSRYHARVRWDDTGPIIQDLGSRNGTAVNGVQIQERRLQVGDRVKIGASAIFVFLQPDELERRVQQLQKLDAMTTLAATIGHDLRNILMIVAVNVEMVLDELAAAGTDHADLVPPLRDVFEAAQRASDLTSRLVTFGRRNADPEPRRAVSIDAAVRTTLELVRHNRACEIRFVVEVPAGLQVRAAPSALHQILLNLCINAIDAMPQGGLLGIAATTVELSRAAALTLHLPDEGRYVDLRVTDTGIGMEPETLERVFEPYFTTKPPGKGTGLGLASVFGLVRNHRGAVLAESTPGSGSMFRVLLPAD